MRIYFIKPLFKQVSGKNLIDHLYLLKRISFVLTTDLCRLSFYIDSVMRYFLLNKFISSYK